MTGETVEVTFVDQGYTGETAQQAAVDQHEGVILRVMDRKSPPSGVSVRVIMARGHGLRAGDL